MAFPYVALGSGVRGNEGQMCAPRVQLCAQEHSSYAPHLPGHVPGSVPAENLNFQLSLEGRGSGPIRSGPSGLTS